MTTLNKAIFLDRDGVINRDDGYVYQPETFHFLPSVFEACRHFQKRGYLLVIVTNQSGIARGYYTEDDFHQLTQWMLQEFQSQGVQIAGVYYCPHHPDKGLGHYLQDCQCRKPMPGMLLEAIQEHQIDPSQSIMIGDKASDMLAAQQAQIAQGILVLSGQSLTVEEQQLAHQVWNSLEDYQRISEGIT